MISKKISTLLFAFFLFALPVRSIFGQTLTSATVVGTVRDTSGAVFAGATVRIRQPQTDSISTTVSGSTGQYRFPFLKPGDYEISAESNGLSGAPVIIHLLVGQEQSVDLALSVASVSQTVHVEAGNGLLQTENGNNVTDYHLHS